MCLLAAITDLDAGFDHKDGQAGLGRRLYYDEFAAYLINAPASSEVLAQSTAVRVRSARHSVPC